MTTNPEPAGEPVDNPFDVPELNLLDNGSIRRAVRRGIALTGLAAAAWLLLATVVLYIGAVVVTALGTQHFHDLAYYGAQVGRPGYVVDGNSCCSGAFGLGRAQELELHQRGALGATGPIVGRVWQGVTGTFGSALPDDAASPIGAALQRERPTKAGTAAFLGTLPPLISAAAIIEFSTPLDAAAVQNFPFNDPGSLSSSVPRVLLLTDPYGGQVVSWPQHSVADFPAWVAALTPDDDNELGQLGAPSVATLRTAATTFRTYAVVVEQATTGDLQALLKNPNVRSVNVAEVEFDPSRQNLPN